MATSPETWVYLVLICSTILKLYRNFLPNRLGLYLWNDCSDQTWSCTEFQRGADFSWVYISRITWISNLVGIRITECSGRDPGESLNPSLWSMAPVGIKPIGVNGTMLWYCTKLKKCVSYLQNSSVCPMTLKTSICTGRRCWWELCEYPGLTAIITTSQSISSTNLLAKFFLFIPSLHSVSVF